MHTAEIVVSKMQGDRGFQVCQLLAERIRLQFARPSIISFSHGGESKDWIQQLQIGSS
jgi:hypothetical protein